MYRLCVLRYFPLSILSANHEVLLMATIYTHMANAAYDTKILFIGNERNIQCE